jgi:YVTN family beta-propeller protein
MAAMRQRIAWRWRRQGGRRQSRLPRCWATALALCALAALLVGCGSSSAQSKPLPVLSLPAQLAGYHVFVSDVLTGDVAELGVRTIHVAQSIHGLGISSDGHTLFVTDIADNRLIGYDLDGGTLGAAHSVGVGIEPVHMVETLDRKTIYVTDFGAQTVSVVDAATWTLRATIVVPGTHLCLPHSIVSSPDGRWVYVACYGNASIAVIDAAQAKLATTIALPVLAEPYGLEISADGHALYASDNFAGRLFVINTATRQLMPTLTLGQRPALIARAPDGKALYVTNGGSHSISPVNIAPDPLHPTVRPPVNVDGYPHGIAVSPDGRYVIVANTYGKNLSVIDASTLQVVAAVEAEQDPINVLVTR